MSPSAEAWTLVLVSGSPRRREMLAARGFRLEIATPPDDVVEVGHGDPEAVVLGNAGLKVDAYLARHPEELAGGLRKVFLGVDTIVECDGEILGKPSDEADARRMLGRLSGRTHRVYSAIQLRRHGGVAEGRVACTRVRFRPLTAWDLDYYVATGEPLDKAGAYGIQGAAGLFIEGIEGCYYNVVGLPLVTLGLSLAAVGLPLAAVMEPSGRFLD